jgi:ATP/maltotriose-dependent transcriptional regulator MalT
VRAHIALIGLLTPAHQSHLRAGHSDLAAQTRARLLLQTRETLFLCADEADAFRRVLMRSNAAGGLMVAGFIDDAVDLLRQSVQQARSEGFRIVELKARCRLARCLSRQGQPEAARRELESILRALDADDHFRARTEVLCLLTQVCAEAGDPEAAAAYRAQSEAFRQRRAQGTEQARRRLQPMARTAREALADDAGRAGH